MPDILIRLDKIQPIANNHGIKSELRRIDGKFELGIRNDGDSHCEHWIWYPVEELPPHGELIETKDVLLALVEHGQRDKRFKLGDTIRYSPSEVKEIIDASVPVIVPAERSDTDA